MATSKWMQIKLAGCSGGFPEEYWQDNTIIAEDKKDGDRRALHVRHDLEWHPMTGRRTSVKDGLLIEKGRNLPNITAVNLPFPDGTILDGEVVVPGGNSSDTTTVMGRKPRAVDEQKELTKHVQYCVFDIIFLGGKDMRELPMKQRRKQLEKLFQRKGIPKQIKLIKQRKVNKKKYFDDIVENGGEGVVLKDINTTYGSGWYKAKKVITIDTVIMGYKEGKGKYADTIGSLRLGVYKGGNLVEVALASGMDDEIRRKIGENRERFIGKIVEVSCQEVTKKGRLRHPQFKEFRTNKNKSACDWATQIMPYMPANSPMEKLAKRVNKTR